jgi:hypothetical protein
MDENIIPLVKSTPPPKLLSTPRMKFVLSKYLIHGYQHLDYDNNAKKYVKKPKNQNIKQVHWSSSGLNEKPVWQFISERP